MPAPGRYLQAKQNNESISYKLDLSRFLVVRSGTRGTEAKLTRH